MGNVLDIPPPSSKQRPDSQIKHHYLLDRTISRDSGVYPDYQSYGGYDGSPTIVTVNPFTAYPYTYPDGSPQFVVVDLLNTQPYSHTTDTSSYQYYRTTEYLSNGSYGNQDGVVLRDSQHKKRHIRRHGRSEKRDVADSKSTSQTGNINLTSTIIATFPDPQDDHIKKGHEIVVTSGALGSRQALTTITSGAINLSSSSCAKAAPTTDTLVNQNMVIQTQVTSAPVATRGSTYVTYIQDDPSPPPPEPAVPETSLLAEGKHEIQSQEIILDRQQPEHHHGKANGEVAILHINKPVTTATRVVKETTARSGVSDWLKRISSAHSSSVSVPDVVVLHDPADSKTMWRITRELQSEGLSLAVSGTSGGASATGSLDWSQFSQAVVDAKVMIVLLSVHSVNNIHLKHQIALALVTDTSIHPVALSPSQDILTAMDISLKLLLTSHVWAELAQGADSDTTIEALARGVKDELDVIRSYDVVDEEYGEVSSWAQQKKRVFRQRHMKQLVSFGTPLVATSYWDKFYATGVNSIPWERFSKDLRSEYRELLKCIVPLSCIPRLMDNLKRELRADRDGLVHQAEFVVFCTVQGVNQDVWERIRTLAGETQAIMDVLGAESTVRLVAIKNIYKFSNPGVVFALRDVIHDNDPRIRAVATLSLSRCVLARDPVIVETLMTTLEDKNQHVREAGCMAMSHISEPGAVNKLRNLRKTDVVAEVREAAAEALRRIGVSGKIKVHRIVNVSSGQVQSVTGVDTGLHLT